MTASDIYSNPMKDSNLAIVQEGLFISDLHLFSERADERQFRNALSGIRWSDQCVVLGGDIFDFRWSCHGGLEPSIEAALAWLEQLLEDLGDAQVVYLPGNHDSHPDYLQRLQKLAQDNPRFHWQRHWLRMADCFFLHGDILAADGCERRLQVYRSKFHKDDGGNRRLDAAYRVVVHLRAHRWVPRLLNRPRPTCERLWKVICDLPIDSVDTIRRVFFGHIHVPINGLTVRGVQFFNSGAGLRHMQVQPHWFTV